MATEDEIHELLDRLVAGQEDVHVRGGAAVAENQPNSDRSRTFRQVRSKGQVIASAYQGCSFPSTGAHAASRQFATQRGARLASILERYCIAANKGSPKPPVPSPQAMHILSHIRETFGFKGRVRIHAEVRVGSAVLDVATAVDLVTPIMCSDGLVRLAFIEVKSSTATFQEMKNAYNKVVDKRKTVLGMPCSIRGRYSSEARLAVLAACAQHNIPLHWTVPVVLLITSDNKLSQVTMRWSESTTFESAVQSMGLLKK